ncbi:carboxylesterase/lipase family protein [Solimonas terrae]|uniref:Carboxylic ester hydrolase n=1 Tax=Solimonas terrae TaxID=1396819 RepID=A0A6M2BV09_9GAMM|nr:carboxylesterase family protein [Solimonas terrae]NGY05839.1 carboxylesterase family protein [Solimonas terrae]
MTTVRIAAGEIRGRHENALHSFKGIPYAEPLSGPARWLPPQPRKPWQGTLDAGRYGPRCMQFGQKAPGPFLPTRRRYFEASGGLIRTPEDDDCLRLNVWTPTLERGARLPVMVYIHGGGFVGGAADALYDAAPFAHKGVVAVVLQYRLGPPGFLHGSGLFDGDLCADNRGFLDQLAALRWVQENIEAFGGDPGKVTIFGESAGAFSVYPLVASPLGKGLFRRAIAMGGMAETCAPAADYHALTRDVLQDIGVQAGKTEQLLALGKPALQRLQDAVSKRIFGRLASDRYGVISHTRVPFLGAAIGGDFLPEAPLAAYRRGTSNKVDLMLGTCGADGQLFSLALPLPMSWSARLFMRQFKGLMPAGDPAPLIRHYRHAMPDASRTAVIEQVNNDTFYRMPTIAAAEAHAAGRTGHTYLYELEYQSAISGLRAIHAIDVALLFGSGPTRHLIHDDDATRRLSDLLLDAWTRFARDGVPRASGMPEWPAFDSNGRATMVFDHQPRLEHDYGGSLRQYWATARRS